MRFYAVEFGTVTTTARAAVGIGGNERALLCIFRALRFLTGENPRSTEAVSLSVVCDTVAVPTAHALRENSHINSAYDNHNTIMFLISFIILK